MTNHENSDSQAQLLQQLLFSHLNSPTVDTQHDDNNASHYLKYKSSDELSDNSDTHLQHPRWPSSKITGDPSLNQDDYRSSNRSTGIAAAPLPSSSDTDEEISIVGRNGRNMTHTMISFGSPAHQDGNDHDMSFHGGEDVSQHDEHLSSSLGPNSRVTGWIRRANYLSDSGSHMQPQMMNNESDDCSSAHIDRRWIPSPSQLHERFGSQLKRRNMNSAKSVGAIGNGAKQSSYATISKKRAVANKRADIVASVFHKQQPQITPEGQVWACACAGEIHLSQIESTACKTSVLFDTFSSFKIENSFSEVIIASVSRTDHGTPTDDGMSSSNWMPTAKDTRCLFFFQFGCVVGWDFSESEKRNVLNWIRKFMKDPLPTPDTDEMAYVLSDVKIIKQDTIHLVSHYSFEKLAYSYAFAQSGKLSVFEDKVEERIENAKEIPETLAQTGKVQGNRYDISKRIADLFISRFYINLNTDILDTPDIFWEFGDYAEHYSSCRSYLEIPKRVDILNQRLDIMKDLYNLLNQELTNDHATKLELIVIWLIAAEVIIEIVAILFGRTMNFMS